MIMAHCILMYMRGPQRTRRRGYWLYIFAAAMILNLGSKETAFIYIAIFGSFLLLYFLVRLAQRRFELPGKFIFNALMLGILLGGLMTLGMYIVVDIIPAEIICRARHTLGGSVRFAAIELGQLDGAVGFERRLRARVDCGLRLSRPPRADSLRANCS